MTGVFNALSNPGPVDDIRQDNAHRAGAPNHHHSSGSGENLMVDTHPQPSRPAGGAAAAVEAVRERLGSQSHRYMTTDHRGVSVDMQALVDFAAEIVTEHTAEARAENTALREQLAAEQDAANDAVNELIRQLEDARTEREEQPRRVYESGEAFLAAMGELCPELERGA